MVGRRAPQAARPDTGSLASQPGSRVICFSGPQDTSGNFSSRYSLISKKFLYLQSQGDE